MNEQRRSETAGGAQGKIKSRQDRERERERERARRAKRHPRRNSNTAVSSDSPSSFPRHPSMLHSPSSRIAPFQLPMHTFRHTFTPAKVKSCHGVAVRVPPPSLYYPVIREACKPNKRINVANSVVFSRTCANSASFAVFHPLHRYGMKPLYFINPLPPSLFLASFFPVCIEQSRA